MLAMAQCDGQHLGPLQAAANQNAIACPNVPDQPAVQVDLESRSDPRPIPEVSTHPGAHVGAANEVHGGPAPCQTSTIHDPGHTGRAQGDMLDPGGDDMAHAPTAAFAHSPQPKVELLHVQERAKQTIPPALRRAGRVMPS
jgi:hypothetical protein